MSFQIWLQTRGEQVGSKCSFSIKKVIAAVYNDYNEKLEKAQLAYDYANQTPEVSYEEFYQVRDIRDAIKEEMQNTPNTIMVWTKLEQAIRK